MLKVDFISDIHVDHYVSINLPKETQKTQIHKFCKKLIPENPGEVLIIPGDISHFNFQSKLLLECFANLYEKVFWIVGNHDLYNFPQTNYNGDSRNRIKDLVDSLSHIPNIHFFDDNILN